MFLSGLYSHKCPVDAYSDSCRGGVFTIFQFELRFLKSLQFTHCELCCYVASMWLEARVYLEIIASTPGELEAATYRAVSSSSLRLEAI